VELAAALGPLPDRIVVIGVEGARFDRPGLSPEVAAAVDEAARQVAAVLAHA
jgi:hypothetical protein